MCQACGTLLQLPNIVDTVETDISYIANTFFVSKNGATKASGNALPERIDKPYLYPWEALADATLMMEGTLASITGHVPSFTNVMVYPGTYTSTGSSQKNIITYRTNLIFDGADIVSSDSGTPALEIRGDCYIRGYSLRNSASIASPLNLASAVITNPTLGGGATSASLHVDFNVNTIRGAMSWDGGTNGGTNTINVELWSPYNGITVNDTGIQGYFANGVYNVNIASGLVNIKVDTGGQLFLKDSRLTNYVYCSGSSTTIIENCNITRSTTTSTLSTGVHAVITQESTAYVSLYDSYIKNNSNASTAACLEINGNRMGDVAGGYRQIVLKNSTFTFAGGSASTGRIFNNSSGTAILLSDLGNNTGCSGNQSNPLTYTSYTNSVVGGTVGFSPNASPDNYGVVANQEIYLDPLVL